MKLNISCAVVNNYLLAFVFSISGFVGVAQSTIRPLENQEIVLSSNDSTVRLNICNTNPKVKLRSNLRYYWYLSHTVYSNQGGYSGHLLNGHYLVFDKQMRLKVEGNFKNGLKEGVWKSWGNNGCLESEYFWHRGLRAGTALLYNSMGNVYKEVPYSNDMIHGVVITRIGDKLEKQKFRNGVEIKKPVRKSKIEKVKQPRLPRSKVVKVKATREQHEKSLLNFWPFHRVKKDSKDMASPGVSGISNKDSLRINNLP